MLYLHHIDDNTGIIPRWIGWLFSKQSEVSSEQVELTGSFTDARPRHDNRPEVDSAADNGKLSMNR